MASVWKHPKSPYWTACFTDKDGKRRKRSTKEKSRKKAEQIATEFEKAATRRRTFEQVRNVIHELHQEITGQQLRVVSVREHVRAWLEQKRDETSAATMQFYEASTDKFLEFFGLRSDEEIGRITEQDVIAYRGWLKGSLSPTSVNHHLKCLRMVFKAAKRSKLIGENPAEFVDGMKKPKKAVAKRIFAKQELEAILKVADPEWQSMTLFGLYTGQRLSDIAGLTWSCVDLEAKELQLTTAKTGKHIKIPIAQPLLRHLEAVEGAKEPDAPIHRRAFGSLNKSYKTSTLSNQFGNILAAAGLREKISHKKEKDGRQAVHERSALSFHSLRHTIVTMLKEANIPNAVVMELVGHDSKQMSDHYTHVGRDAMQQATKALPDLLVPETSEPH